MKRVWTIILCLLLVSAVALTALAANDTKFTVTADKTTVTRGETINVEIFLEGTDLLTSLSYIPNNSSDYYTIGRHYINKDVLEENGSAAILNFTESAGLTVVGYTDYDTEKDIAVTINGMILRLPITIKADAPFGEFTVTKAANIKNGANQVLFNVIEDTITVVCDHVNSAYVQLDGATHKLSCPDCGFEDVAQHTWDEGQVTTEPNCKDTGVKTFTCACGETKTESIPVSDVHTFGAWTSVDAESHIRICGVCEKEETGAHNYTLGKCDDCFFMEPYTVTFAFEDGTVIATATYHYGDTVTVPADPTKEADAVGTYTFTGWDKEIVAVEDNTTYTALFDCEHNDPDLDGTGAVTDADAIYLLRYTLFPEDYPAFEKMMDINNDGQVTDADAIYLLRHTLFPEDYPLYPKKEQ